MNQLTVRGFDDELAERIRRLAKRDGTSLNQAALKLLRKGAGLADQVSRVNYICRLASISFAGSPPWPGPVAGQRWSGSWGRQTPG